MRLFSSHTIASKKEQPCTILYSLPEITSDRIKKRVAELRSSADKRVQNLANIFIEVGCAHEVFILSAYMAFKFNFYISILAAFTDVTLTKFVLALIWAFIPHFLSFHLCWADDVTMALLLQATLVKLVVLIHVFEFDTFQQFLTWNALSGRSRKLLHLYYYSSNTNIHAYI